MRDDVEAKLTDAEAAALSALRTDLNPPSDLEARVFAALPPAPARPTSWIRPLLAAAAAVLVFFAGHEVGRRGGAAPADGPQFMLLLYEDESYDAPAPGRESERASEYGAWAAMVSESGLAIDGDELLEGGVTLSGSGGLAALEQGVPVTTAGRLAGYFIVSGTDLDEAVGVARDTPHLRHGGRVAVVPLAGH